jgi:hypothetical protein
VAALHLQSDVPLHTRNGWLFFRGNEFSDLAATRQWRKFPDPYSVGIFYAPAGLALLNLLSRIPFPAEYLVFAVLVLGATAGAALAASAGCRRWVRGGLVIAFLLSYATQFGLERGNLEAIGLVLLVPAALAAEAGFSGFGGAVAGVFASLKLVGLPLLLGAGPRRARWLLSGVAMVLVLHVSASVAQGFGPVDSARAVVDNAQSTASQVYDFDLYANPDTSVQFSSSADSMVIAGAAFARGPGGVDTVRPIVESSAYLAIKLLLVGLACLWAFFFDDKQWRRVAIVYSCYILVPPVSFDYKLVLLLVPLTLLLRSGAKTRVELAVAVSLALALIPKAYWYLGDSPTSTNCVLGPLTIMVVLLLCLGSGIADRIHSQEIETTPASGASVASIR